MYDERNGYRTPPVPSRYAPQWLERYRAAQHARVARLDAIARRHVAEAQQARAASRLPDFAGAPAAHRALMRRHAMGPRIMLIYRTQANPNYLDLSLDPSERAVGSIFSPRPDLFNYHVFGLARVVTPEAWLSTWSGISSHANLIRNLQAVTVPTLVVGAMGDQDIFIGDAHAEFAASGASDKQLVFIEGADHFMRAGGSRAQLGDPRPRLMKLLSGWTRETLRAGLESGWRTL
jgi:pimeloyl-ACP methyl ester carboxylesterase